MILPPNVTIARDRHGKKRFRFRKKGFDSRYLPEPGSAEFDTCYQQCLDPDAPKRERLVRQNKEPVAPVRRTLTEYRGRELVYFIGMRSSVKIGTTINLYARLKKLQTGCPARLELLACVDGNSDLEAQYHQRFAPDRLHGEWFKKTPQIMAEITKLKRSNDQPAKPNRYPTRTKR